MRDLFAKARAMHQHAHGLALGGNANVEAPAAPAAPGHGPGPVSSAGAPVADFNDMAKKFGLDKLKLDQNPVVARTQLMAHLQQKYGPGYLTHPGVSDLISSFNTHSVGARERVAMSSQGDRTVKTLLGG